MKFRSFINEKTKCPEDGCIQKKSNGKWGVISGKTGKFWDADYNTEEDAKAGLKAYFVRKESLQFSNKSKALNEAENIDYIKKFPFIGNPNEKIPIYFVTRKEIKANIKNYKAKCTQDDYETFIDNYPSYISDIIMDDENFSEFMSDLLDIEEED